MTASTGYASSAAGVFKALGDPIRWNIVQQMAALDELACSRLEETLPISRPTISYHTKILVQAGLISVRKQGRNFFYTLRRDVLQELLDEIRALAPEPQPVRAGRAGASHRRRAAGSATAAAADAAGREGVLLTRRAPRVP